MTGTVLSVPIDGMTRGTGRSPGAVPYTDGGPGIGMTLGIGAMVPGAMTLGTGAIPGIAAGVIPDAICLGEDLITALGGLITAGPSFRSVPSIPRMVPATRAASGAAPVPAAIEAVPARAAAADTAPSPAVLPLKNLPARAAVRPGAAVRVLLPAVLPGAEAAVHPPGAAAVPALPAAAAALLSAAVDGAGAEARVPRTTAIPAPFADSFTFYAVRL